MARNYEGEKKQMAFTEEFILQSLEEAVTYVGCDIPEEQIKVFRENPALFVKDKFDHEWNCEYEKRRTPILYQRLGDWIRNGAFNGVPTYWDDILELRDEWGYTTEDQAWKDNFFPRLGNNVMRYCEKHNVYLGD